MVRHSSAVEALEGIVAMTWAEKIAKLREGMKPFTVTLTRTYSLMAHDDEHALRTIQLHDERTLRGLEQSESFHVSAQGAAVQVVKEIADDMELALAMSRLVHNECKDVPHDIGLKLFELVRNASR